MVALAAIAASLAPVPASAERWYGFGGGAATTLWPADSPGGWICASATQESPATIGSRRVTRARGEVVAHVGGRRSWAVTPLLMGDAGARLGPVEIFGTAGVQLFGGARREDWTVFATFGLLGGVGLSFDLADALRLSLRGQLIWLPSATTARIEGPPDPAAAKPRFLYAGGSLSLELRHDLLAGQAGRTDPDGGF